MRASLPRDSGGSISRSWMVSDPHQVSSLSYSETLLRRFYSFAKIPLPEVGSGGNICKHMGMAARRLQSRLEWPLHITVPKTGKRWAGIATGCVKAL